MKNIIILVDVQVGFVKTEYAEESFKRVQDLMSRNLFDTVIATQYYNEEGSIIARLMDWHDLCTPEEQALRPEIADCVDYVLRKNTYTSINEEMIDLLKKVNGGDLPEYVFVLGYDTECCVATTATDLFELGIRPLLLADYTGSHDGAVYHEAGLVSLDHLIGPDNIISGVDIKSPDDIEAIVKRFY